MNYPLLSSFEKGCLSQQRWVRPSEPGKCCRTVPHVREGRVKILLYLIKCSLAPCSGYLGKQKRCSCKTAAEECLNCALLQGAVNVLATPHGQDGNFYHWNRGYT